jgi:hypothetical protein
MLYKALQRLATAWLHPGAIGHEIRAAGCPNSVALLRRRFLRGNLMYVER